MKINNLTNDTRKVIGKNGPFTVFEYEKDLSVPPSEAINEFFMSKMNVRKRQVLATLNGENRITTQAGAMQWTIGNVESVTGVKGVGDLIGKIGKGAVTKESAIKPEYVGRGYLMLEPTYKHILLANVATWGEGMVIEDGLFLASESTVNLSVQARKNISSIVAGGEGLFNTKLTGEGVVVLESNVPMEELIVFELENDALKIDGNMAVAWSASLQFSAERSSKSLVGSAFNNEGLVNVYRGTGKVLMSPVAESRIDITPKV